MDKLTRLFVKVRESQRGQTMAEYALILSAVAVVVFIALPDHGRQNHHAADHGGRPAISETGETRSGGPPSGTPNIKHLSR